MPALDSPLAVPDARHVHGSEDGRQFALLKPPMREGGPIGVDDGSSYFAGTASIHVRLKKPPHQLSALLLQ